MNCSNLPLEDEKDFAFQGYRKRTARQRNPLRRISICTKDLWTMASNNNKWFIARRAKNGPKGNEL
jgi:hypothetical protein